MTEEIKKLKELIDGTDSIVFFGGAGVSTESGIPDFRSVDGLYNQKYDYPPETILSHSFFMAHPEEYYKFHRDKLVVDGAKPNRAHLRLAELEREGKLQAVITQNIDGLHQAAGSENANCTAASTAATACAAAGRIRRSASTTAPVCRTDCGGIIRPDIVFYEECLDDDVVSKAVHYIREAEVLIVGGTSLAVYPAAGLLNYYRGSKLVLINRSATPYDDQANLIIHEKIGEVFAQV